MLQITTNERNAFTVSNVDGLWHVNDAAVNWDAQVQPNGLISVLYNNKSYTAVVEKVDTKNKELTLRINGQPHKITIEEPIDQLLKSMGLDLKAMQKIEPVKAPMPGMILKVLVEPGQQINKGDGLLILEAMKMENVLKATGTATVKAIKVDERTAVEKGAVLIELE
ncbi:MAG: acetyl-CoA carboxylase biotin carboxyl carrier protein subunit [Sphingobacteriales bacterium]|nr:MAG: acetyl-CoA carboxylase biotin carboxyl carrier protein subunit [Sphingobacteriales bacterium]